MERRHRSRQVRSDGKCLSGTCVVYDEWSDLLFDHFYERVAPGAFDGGMERDIYCSFDHDRERLLGRTSAGTLTLRTTPTGIDVECPIPPYSWAGDLVASIQRGDLTGMSFVFDVTDDRWEMHDGKPHRTVLKAELYEVSFVYFPAYPQTEASIRSAGIGSKLAVETAISLGRFESRLRRQKLLEVDLCQ